MPRVTIIEGTSHNTTCRSRRTTKSLTRAHISLFWLQTPVLLDVYDDMRMYYALRIRQPLLRLPRDYSSATWLNVGWFPVVLPRSPDSVQGVQLVSLEVWPGVS